MIVRRTAAPLALILLALSACGGEPDPGTADTRTQGDGAAAIPVATGANAPIVAAPTRQPPAPVDSTAATGIPAAFQGRWAQHPADCAGGPTVFTVGADGVQTAEARGTLAAVSNAAPARFHGRFNFQGEGEQWQMDELLELQGSTMTRTEYGRNGLPGPISYQRCAA